MIIEICKQLRCKEEVPVAQGDQLIACLLIQAVDNLLSNVRYIADCVDQVIVDSSFSSRVHALIDLIDQGKRCFRHLQQADEVHHCGERSLLRLSHVYVSLKTTLRGKPKHALHLIVCDSSTRPDFRRLGMQP